MSAFQPIDQPRRAVLGGGAWGTALAAVLARHKTGPVALWAREAETVAAINETHINHVFLPDIALPETIHATDKLADLAASTHQESKARPYFGVLAGRPNLSQ